MRLLLERDLPCPAWTAWERFCSPEHLRSVSWPLLTFGPRTILPPRWVPHVRATLQLKLFGFLPWSTHTILITELDDQGMHLATSEKGGAIRSWNHQFKILPLGPDRCRCSDEVQIDAGLLNWFVGPFSQILYRYRYYRWSKLIQKQKKETGSST